MSGEHTKERPRIYLETYGCQMNEADSEMMLGLLQESGWETTQEPAVADLILLNTCAVRERAEERVAGRVRQLARLKRYRPDLRIGLAGCMAKHLGASLLDRLPQLDVLVGPDSYRRLAEIIVRREDGPLIDLTLDRTERYEGIAPAPVDGRLHAWIPIMRGCDRFCTFCVVPLVRGREKSLPMDAIVAQAEALASGGTMAVTLLGQTVNSYRDGERDFAALLDRVAAIGGLRRIRYTSPHPADFTDEVFDVMAARVNVCKHIHLPVQSGSDRVLEDMKRGHGRGEFIDLVARIRRRMPDVSLTTDLIVGFPGETEGDFASTLSLLEEVRFDGAFMFRYSPRPGTYAFRKQADDVPDEVKARRLDELIRVQEEISLQRHQRWVGREVEVMIECPSKRDPERMRGKSDDFKTVVIPRQAGDGPGVFRKVRVARATSHTLFGEGCGERDADTALDLMAE